MNKTKVLFILQQMEPYLPENLMSKKGKELPQNIQQKGKEIRIFMPRYGFIKERRYQLHEVIRLSGMNIIVNDTDHSLIIKVASIPQARMQVYFIDNEEFFHRKATFYDEEGNFYEDNDERAIFYSKSVLETIKKLRWSPDIVYIQGWLAALVPIYIRKLYTEDPIFSNTKIITALFNDGFTETLKQKMKKKAKYEGITDRDLSLINTPNYVNLMKLALKYSNGAVLEENNINPEITDYIKKLKIPVLEATNENYIDEHNQFYDKLLS